MLTFILLNLASICEDWQDPVELYHQRHPQFIAEMAERMGEAELTARDDAEYSYH